MSAPAGSNERVRLFLRDYICAPEDADVDIALGSVPEAPGLGLVIVTISMDGRQIAGIGFPREDAEALADLAEDTGAHFPKSGMARLAIGLRRAIALMPGSA